MSRLTDFYRGFATDTEGRTLSEVWSWDDEELEVVHDWVQWLFPLPEPSRFNPDAPLLAEEDIATFRSDEGMKANLRRSFRRFLSFLGFEITPAGEVVEGPNFTDRVPDVWRYPNHNWLRITRVLRSLTVLRLEKEAESLFRRLDAVYSSRRFPVTAETFGYWEGAVGG